MSLTYKRASELLTYDPLTGWLTWKVARGKVRVGERAGTIDAYGHRTIGIDGKKYRAARVVFLLMRKRWPKRLIDHKNSDPSYDRWRNLREATHAQNMRNSQRRRTNKTGFKGVVKDGRLARPFRASIDVNGRKKQLGSFASAEEAHAAYLDAARKQYGEFAHA